MDANQAFPQRPVRRVLVTAGLVLSVATGVSAQSAQSTNYDELYARYLNAARATPSGHASWMGELMADRNAHRVNDLVTVRVLESLSATGSADSTVGKGSKATAVMPSPVSKALQKVFPFASDSKFSGNGGTTRTTELVATVTARVTEILPTGDMVIEGVREVDINGDRNVVVLSGVVRTADIQPGNVILSTDVGQLRIRSLSQGLIHDSLAPGWFIRIFNKIF